LKILQVIPSLAAAHGGPSRALGIIESALRKHGIVVETATTDDDGPGQVNGRPTGVPLNEDGATRWYFRKRLDFYKVAPGLGRWVGQHARDYDLVHIHALFSYTSAAAAGACRRSGVPYVIRPLGTLSSYGVARRRPWLKRLSLAWVEGPLLRDAAAVHFTSGAEQREAEALGIPMRGVVIPLAVEPPEAGDPTLLRARFGISAERRILLYLSRLDPKKNLEGLLRGFALCRDRLADVCLAVAGAGPPDYSASLQALAGDLGLGEHIVWTGHLDGALKASGLAAAQAFILPSFSENFGIAAAEALAAGLPCVLGNGVALAEEVAESGAGISVEPEPGAIAAGMVRVMADDAVRQAMAGRASALAADRYSVAAMGRNLKRLYERILG